MPNHVMNRLTFRAAQARVDQVLAEIAYTEQSRVGVKAPWGPGTFDFNTVIPMPDAVAQRTLKDMTVTPPAEELDWYHWSLANWGAKWNSCDCSRTGPNSISFHTAWLPVPRVIEALSRKYPDVEIEYAHCDTGDWGAHVGTSTLRNGDCVRANSPKAYSKEAYELIFAIEGMTAEDIGMRFDETAQKYIWAIDDDAEDEEAEENTPTAPCPDCGLAVDQAVLDQGCCPNCGFI